MSASITPVCTYAHMKHRELMLACPDNAFTPFQGETTLDLQKDQSHFNH